MNEEQPLSQQPPVNEASSPVDEEIKQEDVIENLLCLPAGWVATLPEVDQFWISDFLFKWSESYLPELDRSKIDQQWHYPPQPPVWASHGSNVVPALEQYFGHPLFLWMPITQLNASLVCPQCKTTTLTHAGLHQELKQVVGYDNFYYLASESLFCVSCNQSFIAWSNSIISQLDIGMRLHFPCLLTQTLGCDKRVVRLMRQRGFENLQSVENLLEEQYEEGWVKKRLQFTTEIQSSTGALLFDGISPVVIGEMPTKPLFPKHDWFMQVYVQDVLSRMDEIKASITSLFGQALTIDSSRVLNLSGQDHLKAAWLTNVWNEHGQIIMSVLTENEGCDLTKMADGLVQRYKEAGEKPPKVLYVDRECCGASIFNTIFGAWPEMKIRLDVGHFKRGFSAGCTSEFHDWHKIFMTELSQCILDWDEKDMKRLREAKQAELEENGITPTEAELIWHIKKAEMKLHCKKKIRDTGTIEQMIERLIEVYAGQTRRDSLGAPLFDSEKIKKVWEVQRRHIPCLQNPPGLSLYTKTRTMKQGERMPPVYQCARGATFMKSLNQHMDRFNPGVLASPSVFQALLVDGLYRWNEGRIRPKKGTDSPSSRSSALMHQVNELAQSILGKKILDCTAPQKYTGELIGIEYLYSEANKEMEHYQTTASLLEEQDLVLCTDHSLPVPLKLETPSPSPQTVEVKEEPLLLLCKEEDIQNPIQPPNIVAMASSVKCEVLAPSTDNALTLPLKLDTASSLSPTVKVKEEPFLALYSE